MQNEKPTIASPYKIYGYFLLGLSTAIAFRALIVLDHVQPGWVRPVWYFGVLGNFVFFLYRFRVTERRKKVVKEFQLIEKVRFLPLIRRTGSAGLPAEFDKTVAGKHQLSRYIPLLTSCHCHRHRSVFHVTV